MNSFLASGEFPAHRQGKHGKRLSILIDLDITKRCTDWLKSQKATHRSIPALRNFIRDNVFPDTLDLTEAENVGMEDTIETTNHPLSNETLSTYMKQWEFNYREGKDQIYFNGHERPDIVGCRVNWAKQMMKWHSRMEIYLVGSEGEVPVQPESRRDEKKMVLFTLDESIFYSNDCKMTSWVEDKETFILPRGQVEQLKKVIVLFELLHPNCTGVFAFDQSPNHKAMTEDALIASQMNPGKTLHKEETQSFDVDKARREIKRRKTNDEDSSGDTFQLVNQNCYQDGPRAMFKVADQKVPKDIIISLIDIANDLSNEVLTKINALKKVINTLNEDMDPILVKLLLCFKALVETLPSNIQQKKVKEHELCTRYLQPFLRSLFDSNEDDNMLFKWINTITFSSNGNEDEPVVTNRPDGCIENDRKTIGYVEVKTIDYATNHHKINIDLHRLGTFGKTALSKYNLNKTFQVMAIGKLYI
ncbi:hypothetical protein G6F56_006529 [Rhizopus delemar]|nr:hypothetical protein G6F56_006529 [Rhizopus delemar]